jgi:hypothetical protein
VPRLYDMRAYPFSSSSPVCQPLPSPYCPFVLPILHLVVVFLDRESSLAVAVVDMAKDLPFGKSRMAGSGSVLGGCMRQVAGTAKAR